MNQGSNWLHHDHRRYEAVLEDCRVAAEREEWRAARRLFEEFLSHLKLHMRMEEEVVYPAYDQAEGGPQKATQAMRDEHEQIVRLLRDLSWILKTNDSEHFLESLVPLRHAMMEHHEHEEQVFLPMAERVLLDRREEILKKLEEFGEAHAGRRWDF